VADKRLDTYLVLLAPVLVRIDGVTDDPADVEIAEAILVAAESADGVGVTRSEIAARAGLDPADPRFAARFDMLARAGALQHLRGDKKHQSRYLPDPVALLSAEILARLNSDHGAEELHSLLVAAADRLEAAFREDADTPPPTVEEVAVLVTKLAVLLHAYAQRMEAATTAGTYQNLIRARTGSSTSQQMEQIERVCRAINREKSPYGRLFHDANRLLAAGQRFVAASEQLTKRLVEVVTKGEGGSVLGWRASSSTSTPPSRATSTSWLQWEQLSRWRRRRRWSTWPIWHKQLQSSTSPLKPGPSLSHHKPILAWTREPHWPSGNDALNSAPRSAGAGPHGC
jgi:hypothetical protein